MAVDKNTLNNIIIGMNLKLKISDSANNFVQDKKYNLRIFVLYREIIFKKTTIILLLISVLLDVL